MKSHKKLLSLILVISILFCCLTNLFVMASDIDVSSYTYVVDNMTFYKGDNKINSLKGATEVAVDVTRRVAGEDSDRLIISTYSATGEYIGMYSVTHYIDFGKTSTVKVLLNVPEGKTVGEIKAFVWKSFSDMTPLSNVLSSENNMIIDPKFEYDKELQTSFTDVSVNDTFADAVSLMAYLRIMNGYEDGTFRPTTNLRVADAARLITYMTKGQAAASILEDEILVADQIPTSVERGYINYCVDAEYLIPDENGYVNYNDNMTTAEFLKLTVNALGYSNLANVSGGWPRGYVSVATQYGIADVSDLNYSAPITRGTAAEILYSAINAPIAQIVGYTYDASGALVPKIQIQDGVQSSYYQSMLTQNFNIYSIDGYVVATQKDNTGLKADEVDFAIAKTKKYNQDDVCILNAAGNVDNVNTLVQANVAGRILSRVNVGDTDAADYKGTYATAYIKLDTNNNWEFVKFIPSDKNIVYTFDLKDIDDADYALTSTAPYLKFFVDDATISTKYLLDPVRVAVYVNGVKVTLGDPIDTYVINGDVGEVKLVDTYKSDGKIDTIYVNKYVSGMFDGITSAGKISFKSPDAGLSYIVLDDEDESLEYNIYYNGEAITVDDLKKDDVLTIAYDVTATSVRDSKFFDIYVSRDVVTDTLKGRDNDEKAAKFGNTYYQFASDAKFTSFASAKLGDEYTLYLDAFGRIFKAEQNTSAANWAIVEKFTLATADDDYKVTMFTADGTEKAYYFDANSASVTLADGTVINKTTEGSIDALNTAVKNLVYSSGTTKKTIDTRVIQYKVTSSSGKINELKFMGVKENTIDTSVTPNTYKEEYSERRNAIGTIKLGEATKLIDATEYYAEQELTTATYASLVDEVYYRAYAYGTKIDSVYPFVLITEGQAAYNKRTRFAVITEDGYEQDIDEETGDIVYTIGVMYGDEEKLVVSDDISTATLNNLKKGEVILFKTNSKGQVYHIDELTTWSAVPTQAALATGSLVDNNTTYSNLSAIDINNCTGGNFSSDFTHDWDSSSRDAIKVVYGPIMERTNYDITFGKIDDGGMTNTVTDVSIFDFSDDIRVYTYDYSQGEKYRLDYQDSNTSAIIPSCILKENMGADGITVDWNKTVDGVLVNQEYANFAFAIVVDDVVQDIFTFITDSDIIIPDSSDEEITFNESFAIAEKFTLSVEDDDYKLTLFTDDGVQKAYYFDANSANVTLPDGSVINATTEGSPYALTDAVRALIYTAGTTKKPIDARVIQYKVKSSTGKINELKFMPVIDNTIDTSTSPNTTKEEYSARKNAIGTIKLSDETKIIDATKYFAEKELSPATYASLTDEVEYKAYAYGTTINGIYPFVLITEGQTAYTSATRFAVVTEDGYAEDMDDETGNIIYTIKAMYGDAESLVVSDDISTTTLNNLKKGEVILFKTNSKGQVYHIDELTTWSGVPTQAALAAGSLVNNNTTYTNLSGLAISDFSGANFSSDFTTNWDSTSRGAIKVVYGPVMQRTDSDIAFGKVDGLGKTNTDTDVSIFGFSDDIKVYTYDYAKGEKYRFEYQDKATSAISVTNLLETNMEYDGYTVDWNRDSDLDGWKENQESVTFAFAIVVNDEVQDILVFLHQ